MEESQLHVFSHHSYAYMYASGALGMTNDNEIFTCHWILQKVMDSLEKNRLTGQN